MEEKNLRYYLIALRRHGRRGTLLAMGIFLSGLVLAFLWPPTFRSTATILIEEQEIPPELIRSTITTYATQRLEMISQRVMTRANLQKIIDKFDLYPDSRARLTEEEIIGKMRDDITLDTISADIIDPRTGRPSSVTIAFTLAYDGRNPELTQRVANEITSLYLEENLKNRTEKSAETSEFIKAESQQISEYVAVLENKLADFKEKYFNSLPEQKAINIDLLDRAERELLNVDNEVRTLEDRKIRLDGELAQIKPDIPLISTTGERILAPADRLKTLRTEYLGLVSRYSAKHPDVVKARQEIESLSRETGGVDSALLLGKEFNRLRGELADLGQRYAPDHPDVVGLRQRLAAVQAQIDRVRTDSQLVKINQGQPENPAYLTLRSQRDSTVQELQGLQRKRAELRARMGSLENRLAHSPSVERQYLALVRDYENSTARYRELKVKEMDAVVAEQLEKKSKGERFSVVEPPALPENPVKPPRLVIALLGLVLAGSGGFGYAVVKEGLDTSLRGPRAVALLAGMPPLAMVPWLATEEDIERRRRSRTWAILAAVGLAVLALVLVHFLWIPLDVLWFRWLRKLDSLLG